MDLKYDERGLIPCIVQDVHSKKVLMMAYMNEESLEITLKEKKMCYWSRSRKKLWRKGETSGHVQHLVTLGYDCDKDTLLAQVEQVGPACHTGSYSCFTETLTGQWEDDVFTILSNTIEERKQSKEEGSYTAYLFQEGLDKICKKIGEEATETVIAAKNHNKEELVNEICDLVYHAMVLMNVENINPKEIAEECKKRHTLPRKRNYK